MSPSTSTAPVVATRAGEVQGVATDGITSFLGIPYAAAPFGANRMLPPQPVTSWAGVRPCLEYGPTAPTSKRQAPFDVLLYDPEIPGEDCLNLNVWTPDVEASLPVLVWIHGGGFQYGTGAAADYNGARFARDGVVCVTINYRLGAEGFLYVKDEMANLGILDQIAALEWVRDNIGNFGGDPARVTIAGESAGAMSVATLMSMPRATGLFSGAIAQSGAGHLASTVEDATHVTKQLAEFLDCTPTREHFVASSVRNVLTAQARLTEAPGQAAIPGAKASFTPVIDGEIIDDLPINAIRAGRGSHVRTLVGTTTDEQHSFIVPTGAMPLITDEMAVGIASTLGLSPEAIAAYHTSRPGRSPGEVLSAILTDWMFRIPAVRLAEAVDDAWVYQFDWSSPLYGGKIGACHTLEIPFVFDNLDKGGDGRMLGENPPQSLADEMHRAWVLFAKGENPGWDSYSPENRAVQFFSLDSAVVVDPAADERKAWDGIR